MSKFKQSSIALCIQTVFAASSLLAVQSVYAEEANTSEVAGLKLLRLLLVNELKMFKKYL